MIHLDMTGQEIIYSNANYINKNSNINTECQNPFLTVGGKQSYSQTKQPACFYCQLMNMHFRKNIHSLGSWYTSLISSLTLDCFLEIGIFSFEILGILYLSLVIL